MKVKIIGIYSPGDLEKERVHLQALEDVNISNYAVMDHTFTQDGDLSDKGKHVFKFPKKEISKDDHVILYTKVGTNHDQDRKGETNTNHFIYWNRKSTVWNKAGGDTCTLMEVHDTQVVKVNAD